MSADTSADRAVDIEFSSTPPKNEQYMCERQKLYFRGVLADWLKRIEAGGIRIAESLKDGMTDVADENDRASNEEQMALNLRWHERESRLQQKLREAIARIDTDEFGYCEGCFEAVGLERLMARPMATLCIDCKQIEELKERQGVRL